MIILYMDTSSSYLYAALAKDDKVVGSCKEEFGQNLSELTLPRIMELFKENDLAPCELNKIIVVKGPGSFTGTRIGITIGKTYAWAGNIPITSISSLEAMAISSKSKKKHVPILNARRGYVYTAIYDENMKEILKPQYIKMEELKEKLKDIQDYEFITNDEFDEKIKVTPYSPDFKKIINTYKDKKDINPHALNPEYLKLTEAEESRL